MSDALRAVSLLLSLALWSPVAGQLLRGEVSPERAGLLYAAALVLALGGCGLLSHLVGAYAPDASPQDVDEPGAGSHAARSGTVGAPTPRRRQEDAAA